MLQGRHGQRRNHKRPHERAQRRRKREPAGARTHTNADAKRPRPTTHEATNHKTSGTVTTPPRPRKRNKRTTRGPHDATGRPRTTQDRTLEFCNTTTLRNVHPTNCGVQQEEQTTRTTVVGGDGSTQETVANLLVFPDVATSNEVV